MIWHDHDLLPENAPIESSRAIFQARYIAILSQNPRTGFTVSPPSQASRKRAICKGKTQVFPG
jgi:hypothetical protein